MEHAFQPYVHPQYLPPDEILQNSKEFYLFMSQRRSLRYFSDSPVEQEVMENIIMTAASAPSGANKQPWTFCLVSDAKVKSRIREAAEKEEYENYNGRMSDEWLKDLAPFGTDWHKEFLETAPYLVVIMKKAYDLNEAGVKTKNYYVNESVGIASGILITAIHNAGLVCLTHTPSPMNFLSSILHRPENERPYLLLPVGHPAQSAKVPVIQRKPMEEVLIKYS
jgi:nitroreductase